MEVAFEKLGTSNLVVDAVYKGGKVSGKGAEVLSKLMPGCSNSGGFRKVMRKDGSGLPAYVVLYTSMQELAWPDYLDEETGVFRYYGDNRSPGKTILDTPRKGNQLLEFVFECLNGKDGAIENIPPFFVFKKTGRGWDVQFLGLAAPGNPHISPDKDLVAFWRTMNENRFQNYEAYFTILQTSSPISKEWLHALVYEHEKSFELAPYSWKCFIKQGRNGIIPLIAKKMPKVPTRYEQLQSDVEGHTCLSQIREHYKNNPYGFENCAKDILEKMDGNFQDFSLTRPWRDGGRDALGYYVIGRETKANYPLRIDCAMEAKCFSEKYKEVIEDGHPILIVSASDIARILRKNAVTSSNISEWLLSLDETDNRDRMQRMETYYRALGDVT